MSHDHHNHGGGHQGHDMGQGQGAIFPSSTTMSPMDHSGHHGPQGMHGMAMYFHLGFEQYILLQQWSAETEISLSLTCVFFFVLAILYEILKAYRRVVALQFQISQTARIVHNGGGSGSRRHHGQTGPLDNMGSGGDSAGSSLSAHSSHNGHQKLVPSTGTSSMYVMDPAAPTPDDPTVQVIQSHASHPSYGIQTAAVENGAAPLVHSPGIPLFSTFSEMFSVAHLASTLLYMLQVVFAYLLMLAFMLFNVWICLAILLGAAVGHFLLAHKAIAMQDSANEDYCH